MQFKKIEFKNVFGYGEKVSTIEYTDEGRVILVKGRSGSGKSAMLTLPILALYGKAERVPKNAVANRINKNGWIRAEVSNNGHDWVIERTFSPSSLKLYKDGKDFENYGIKDAQQFINEEIADVPQQMFSNILTVSMRRFKSFLNMSPYDKKMIIDIAFGLDQANALYDICKEDIRKVGEAINASNSTIFALNKTLDNAAAELMNAKSSSAQEDDKKKLEENELKLAELKEKKDKLVAGYDACMKQCDIARKAAADEQQKLHDIDIMVSQLKQKVLLFEQEKCPTCGTPFTSSHFIEVKEKLNAAIEACNMQRAAAAEKVKVSKDASDKVNELLKKVSAASSQVAAQIASITSMDAVIAASMEKSSQMSGIQSIIDNINVQLVDATAKLEEKNLEMDDLQKLLLIYSADGVKEKVVKTYLPLFNYNVKKHLDAIEFPYALEFDSKFDAKLKDLDSEISIETLSDGEMARADLAVLCALFKVLKQQYPSINIFHLDETLSTLDQETSGDVLEFLHAFAREERLNIVIVSHVDMNIEWFDELIEVKKQNGFSEIAKEVL